MSGAGVSDFSAWRPENLAKFCSECSAQLKEKDKEITELRENLRVAIDAYRTLVMENARKTN
jgi:hypothetical protein